MLTDFHIGEWLVRPHRDRIECGGRIIHVKPKSMAVLECLARANSRVVDRQDFFDAIWPGGVVSDDVLTQCIVELRKAFDDSARHPHIIETIPKIGFRLIPAVVPRTSKEVVAPVAEPQPGANTIAVLPFVDMTEEQNLGWYADSLTEDLINRLAQLEGLDVVSRTSSFQFRGRNLDLRSIGENLGVSYVLEGSVCDAESQLRITAQLINTKSGFHVCSSQYDRSVTGGRNVPESIVESITTALG